MSTRTRLFVLLGLVSLSVLSIQRSWKTAKPPLQIGETNVLLIINCTLRRDRLSAFDHEVPTSPSWENWRKRSVTLNHHISQAPWTRPSLGSILTGIYPAKLGLDSAEAAGSLELVLDEQFTTIAEWFKDNGYSTIGAVGNPNAKEKFGLAQGFDEYFEPNRTFKEGLRMRSTQELGSELLAQSTKRSSQQPVFALLITVDTHQRVQYEDQDWSVVADHYPERMDKQQRLQSTYDASVHQLDRQLANFVSQFRKHRPNTLVIQTADHGEGLLTPKHHGRGHGRFLYPSTIHIPHLWEHPQLEPKDIDTLTRNIDIFPTLIELLGASTSLRLDGRSFAPSLWNGIHSGNELAYVQSQYGDVDRFAVYRQHNFWILDVISGKQTIYDWRDPQALNNIIDQNSELAGQNHRLFTQFRDHLSAPQIRQELDEDDQKLLESIGYVE